MGSVNYISETVTIAATGTEVLAKGVRMLQPSAEVQLWFGTDTGGVVSTKGLTLTANVLFEPYHLPNTTISVYSTAGCALHVVR